MVAGLPRISLFASLGIQVALSIIIIDLYSRGQRFLTRYETVSISITVGPKAEGMQEGALPHDLDKSGRRLSLANAILAILTSVATIIMFMLANGKRKRWPCYLHPLYLYPMILLTAILSIVSMICTLSIHSAAAHINPTSQSRTMLASQYAFAYDLENWTCDMRRESTYGYLYMKQCDIEIAMRVLVILQSVAAAMVCATAFWAWPAEKKKYRNVLEMRAVRHQPFSDTMHDEDD